MKCITIFSFLFTFALLITSCSGTKKTTTTTAIKSYNSTTELLQEVNKNQALPQWFSAKTNIHYKTEKENQSVTAQIRMRLDSAIWISVIPLFGIEVARVIITKDSLKYLDRFNKQYSAQSIAALKSYLPIEGDFYALQNIILGNHFNYSEKVDIKSVITRKKNYVMSSLNKRQLKGVVNKNVVIPIDQQNVWILPNTFRVSKQIIIDNTSAHTINIDYENFEETTFGWFAKKTQLLVSSDNIIEIVLKHSRVQHNKYKSMPFNIPAGYESIN